MVAGASPLLPATAVPAEADGEVGGDVCEIQRDQLAKEPGVVSVQEFTGEEAAVIFDECKSSKISLHTFSFVDYHGWTYSANSFDKCEYCTSLTPVSWHLVVQRFFNFFS